MNQIVFKTVQRNGESVHAPLSHGLGRIYEIGKTYTFPDKLPAHVFSVESLCRSYYLSIDEMDFAELYRHRPESANGVRVLICWAEDPIEEAVALFPFWNRNLLYRLKDLLTSPGWFDTVTRLTTRKLTVIGELFVPPSWIDGEYSKCEDVEIDFDGVKDKEILEFYKV